jgi:hypothetical protein
MIEFLLLLFVKNPNDRPSARSLIGNNMMQKQKSIRGETNKAKSRPNLVVRTIITVNFVTLAYDKFFVYLRAQNRKYNEGIKILLNTVIRFSRTHTHTHMQLAHVQCSTKKRTSATNTCNRGKGGREIAFIQRTTEPLELRHVLVLCS